MGVVADYLSRALIERVIFKALLPKSDSFRTVKVPILVSNISFEPSKY